jgi:hypothetical protein
MTMFFLIVKQYLNTNKKSKSNNRPGWQSPIYDFFSMNTKKTTKK